jgi:hypothetical protein
MKYYEFGDNFEMYALIGAINMDTAIENYIEYVYEEDIEDEKPDEISEELAREKLLSLYNTEAQKKRATREFDMFSNSEDVYLIIVDGDCDL